MKNIETIKFICGLTLVSFAILAGLIFYLESFNISGSMLSLDNVSPVFWVFRGDGTAPSNTPIFLGLCGLAGAYLLASVRPDKTENKIEVNSDQPTN